MTNVRRPVKRSSRKIKARKLGIRELSVAAVLLTISIGYLVWSNRPTEFVRFDNGAEFSVEVADTLAERQVGLGEHTSLDNDKGLLFIFEESAEHGFWMKDMDFSIDIIWMDENRRIVHIEENVSPSSYPEIYRPSTNAAFVLELYTGQAAANGLGLGDQATFDL